MTKNDSTRLPHAIPWIVVAVLAGAAAAVGPHVIPSHPQSAVEPMRLGPQVGMPGGPPTSADGLRQRIGEMEQRLREHPQDAGAAVLLADALLRQARATNDGRPANRAGEVLKA